MSESECRAAEPRPALPLGEAARRLGHYAWTESRLFEILGGWVPGVPELEAKLLLGSQCHHHAWHAELWDRRLPALAEVDHDDLTVAPNGAMTACLLAVAGAQTTLEKLVGVYRVLLPHLAATYAEHLDLTSTITDAPTIRALRLVVADQTEDLRHGEAVLRSLRPAADELSRGGAHHRRIEGMLLAAGGVTGPAPAG